MSPELREMPELELALLRRGVQGMSDEAERCHHCHRTPLVGEQVHDFDGGRILCELCRAMARSQPLHSRTVHGPEFGHTLRVFDRRAA